MSCEDMVNLTTEILKNNGDCGMSQQRPGTRLGRSPGLEESRNLESHVCIKPLGNRELSPTSSLPMIQDGNPDCHGIDVIKR